MTLKDLEKRLEKEPDNLPLRVTVAGMMSDAGRKADAVEHYRRVALAYRAQGRAQQALMVARNILELAPGDVAIRTLVTELTEVKTPAPTPTPPPAARPQSSAEPTKTGVRGMPEPRAAIAMPAVEPPPSSSGSQRRRSDEDDIDTRPSAATGSHPPGMLPQRITNVGLRPITTKGPKSTPPVVRIPERKPDSQPPVGATYRSQPPPPPRHSPFPDKPGARPALRSAEGGAEVDDVTDPQNEPPRRSSFEVPTPLPQPMPYHLADPTASQDRISREGLSGLEKLDEQRDDASDSSPPGGLAGAARRISSLIKPRSEKPTRNPFTPDPTLRPDAPALPAPARTAKPAVDPYADKPIVPRSDKPTRQPLIKAGPSDDTPVRADKPTKHPPIADEGRVIAKLPSIVRPGAPPSEPSKVPLRPAAAPTLPPRAPPVTSTSKTQPRPAQPPPPLAPPTPDPDDGADETRPTAPRPAQTRLGDTFRAQPPPAGAPPMLPVAVARPPLRPSDKGPETMKAQPPPAVTRPRPTVPQPARDAGSSGMRAAVPRPATDRGSSGVRAVPQPARAPHDSGATRVLGPSRPLRDTGEDEVRKTTRLPSSPGELRASRDAAALPPSPPRARAPSTGGASRLPRETLSPETRVDNLPPAPEPGADHLPPPPAVPPRAVTAIPRTPSYSDEVVAELDTRQRPRLSSEQLDKIEAPPPTVPTEQVELDDEVTPPPVKWERLRRPGGPPIRDTPMDPPTDVHTSVSRDTSLDMATEAGTEVGSILSSGRDTRRDAAAEPPEDDTAPRELVGPTPLANAFFLAIPPNRREAALTRCIKRVVRAGQTVIRQGETSHPLYLVVSGQLELRVERANGTLAKIDEVDAGQYIGEGSLLARTPAIAHVIASAGSELLALPPHALFELAGAYPALWAALKETAERRARAYERLLRG